MKIKDYNYLISESVSDNMKKISVVIHTYNSEKFLGRCLESVKDADEIIICDMHSTDKTVEIAKTYNCKIVYHENTGYPEPARNFANSQVTSDYFLILDSDEYASKGLIKYLREYIESDCAAQGVRIFYKNEVLGKVLHSYSKKGILRFFKKGCVNYQPHVHAIPEVNGREEYVPNKNNEVFITHTMVDELNPHIIKWNYYTSLELVKMKARNKHFSLWFLISRSILEFFKIYILKQGFRDGVHGFIFAVIAANYKFMAIVKLWEYELKNPDYKKNSNQKR